jgi:ABC-type enterobactin transport system permease subunit
MGNIVTGAVTGVVLYITDVVFREAVPSGGLMEMFKFIIQGMVVTAFVQAVTSYTRKKSYIDQTKKF